MTQSLDKVYALINAEHTPVPAITQTNTVLENVRPAAGNGYNTQATLRALATGEYDGEVSIYYRRLNLALLYAGVNTFNQGAISTPQQLLDALNALRDAGIELADLEAFTVAEEIPGQLQDVVLTAKAGSYGFYGAVTIHLTSAALPPVVSIQDAVIEDDAVEMPDLPDPDSLVGLWDVLAAGNATTWPRLLEEHPSINVSGSQIVTSSAAAELRRALRFVGSGNPAREFSQQFILPSAQGLTIFVVGHPNRSYDSHLPGGTPDNSKLDFSLMDQYGSPSIAAFFKEQYQRPSIGGANLTTMGYDFRGMYVHAVTISPTMWRGFINNTKYTETEVESVDDVILASLFSRDDSWTDNDFDMAAIVVYNREYTPQEIADWVGVARTRWYNAGDRQPLPLPAI